jgi:periplasmic divalent cation tolerance protein
MSTPAEIVVVLSTFPSADKATEVARALVEQHLAACVNILPSVRSVYRWQGSVQEDAETLAVIKTTRDRYEEVAACIVSLHPYELPEVIGLPLVEGHAPYLAWVAGSVE